MLTATEREAAMEELRLKESGGIPPVARLHNQTAEHQELSARALRWLAARATVKGIVGATEIALRRDYVADAVAIASFQERLLRRYLKTDTTCHMMNEFVCVFEVKVTRADFLGTFGPSAKHNNRQQPVGTMHWIVVPKGLVEPYEAPPFWGLLEASGRGLSEKRAPRVFPYDTSAVHAAAYQLLVYGERRAATWTAIPVCPECGEKYPEERRDEG